MNVLLIEDTHFVRKMLVDIVLQTGHTVVGEAGSGEEGLKLFKMLKPDVVITDLAMPGLDGFETMKQIRAVNPGVEMIVCSAVSSKENVIRAVKLGAVDFITKPFREEHVKDSLDKLQSRLSIRSGSGSLQGAIS